MKILKTRHNRHFMSFAAGQRGRLFTAEARRARRVRRTIHGILFLLGDLGVSAVLLAGADADDAFTIDVLATFVLQPTAQATSVYYFSRLFPGIFLQSTVIVLFTHRWRRWHVNCLALLQHI